LQVVLALSVLVLAAAAVFLTERDEETGAQEVDPRIALERSRDREHPEDARAKARVQVLVDRFEACARKVEDYTTCIGLPGIARGVGVLGPRPGQVEIVAATYDSITIRARSRERSFGRHHIFRTSIDSSGRQLRTCTAGPTEDAGGCIEGAWGFADPVRVPDGAAAASQSRGLRYTERAKALAVTIAGAVQHCFESTADFIVCQSPAELGLPEHRFGTAPGKAEVVAATPDQFTVTSYSLTGATFVLTQMRADEPSRTCEPPGNAGCPGDGTW
jgi:hypothetical protein